MSTSTNETPKAQEKKHFLRLPYVKDSETPLYARVTLAAILFRQRLEDRPKFKGASVYWISKYTGIDYKTVKRHIAILLDRQFIKETDGQFQAVKSSRYVFKKIGKAKQGGKWFDNLNTLKLALPLTMKACKPGLTKKGKPTKKGTPLLLPVVLMELLRHCRNEQTEKGLAMMLGVSRQAVGRAIEVLVSCKLITAEKQWVVYPSGKRFPKGFKLVSLQSADPKEYHKQDSYTLKRKQDEDDGISDRDKDLRKDMLADLELFKIDKNLKAKIVAKVFAGDILPALVINTLRQYWGKDVNNHLLITLDPKGLWA